MNHQLAIFDAFCDITNFKPTTDQRQQWIRLSSAIFDEIAAQIAASQQELFINAVLRKTLTDHGMRLQSAVAHLANGDIEEALNKLEKAADKLADEVTIHIAQIVSSPGLVYLGCPVNIQNTWLEQYLLYLLRTQHGLDIIYPYEDIHKENYKKHGMNYYTEKIIPFCVGGIFLPFQDRTWSAGVHLEAMTLMRSNKPVYEITINGQLRSFDPERIKPLSIDETRARIYNDDGTIRPYIGQHLYKQASGSNS